MKKGQKIVLALVLCLTIGLAPFSPEPHVWGKLKWVFGGATGMTFMDWLDLVFHGSPFLLLIFNTLKKK